MDTTSLYNTATNGVHNLGTSAKLFNNLYLSGNLSDGTNSISIANIASKSEIPTAVSELTNDRGYQTASNVSTTVSAAISSQTKENWTFTLADDSTVTKTIVLG